MSLIRVADLALDGEDLANFFEEARKDGWAAGKGAGYRGKRTVEYLRGKWRYTDELTEESISTFVLEGTEKVFFQDGWIWTRVWGMNWRGMLGDNFRFPQVPYRQMKDNKRNAVSALQQISLKLGAEDLYGNAKRKTIAVPGHPDLEYGIISHGDISNFCGHEEIRVLQSNEVFWEGGFLGGIT